MIEIGALAAAVVAALLGWVVVRNNRARAKKQLLLEESAKRLSDGRVMAGELRTTVEGITVTIKTQDRAVQAIARLEEGAERLRIYIGWDVKSVPEGLGHFPAISLPGAFTFEGEMKTNANERAIAEAFLERGGRALIELRSQAQAKSLSVIVRGGHIELHLSGIVESAEMMEALAATTVRLAQLLRKDERSVPAAPAERRCIACLDRGGDDWVACAKCKGAYHRTCFTKAGCTACGETQSEALA